MLTIYHNGECSKSRGALEILQEKGVPHTVRWYMAEPLSAGELQQLLAKLNLKASDLIRKSEPYFETHLKGVAYTEFQWLQVLLTHPELMERSIVVSDQIALIARPPERVLELL